MATAQPLSYTGQSPKRREMMLTSLPHSVPRNTKVRYDETFQGLGLHAPAETIIFHLYFRSTLKHSNIST